MGRPGANLALLLLGGFRALASSATDELAKRGHHDYRAPHDFAMRAIASGATSASELGRRLAMSKQAAAKTISALQERGYIAILSDPGDARRKQLQVTPLGVEVMTLGEDIFNDLRGAWAKAVGLNQIEHMEQCLRTLLQQSPHSTIDLGWTTEA